jgi:hypothetical protein
MALNINENNRFMGDWDVATMLRVSKSNKNKINSIKL